MNKVEIDEMFEEILSEHAIEEIIKNNNITDQNWRTLICNQTLSESFIRKYLEFFSVENIVSYQKLSEEFLVSIDHSFTEDHQWRMVFENQIVTENIIKRYLQFGHNIDSMRAVAQNQYLSIEFINELFATGVFNHDYIFFLQTNEKINQEELSIYFCV